MEILSDFTKFDIADEWAIRSENWISELSRLPKKRKRRDRNSEPLIVGGHGASLRVENDTLLIREGFTHYPQAQKQHRFFPGSRETPPRILLLDGSGTLSFEVLSWLAEQGVALARVKWDGEVATVASGSGFACDHAKVQWQHQIRADETARLAFSADLIARKLAGSIATLENCISESRLRDSAVDQHREGIARLRSEIFADMNDIRAIEGRCAAAYFESWQSIEMQWKGSRAIPVEWRSYTSRSSVANGSKAQNRAASHPINAMLNYAYTVKLAHLKIQAIADGYDPTIGIMHHGRRGKPAYIFDLIEIERPNVDASILRFVQNHSFTAADFILRKDGVCRLSPQLARMVATIVR